MIRAQMATYPARLGHMVQAVRSIAPQVDRVFVVLNEYDAAPAELAGMDNVEPVLPEADTKDTGKFLPEAKPEDDVFLVDDDIIYAPDYVSHTLSSAAATGRQNAVFGYHGSYMRRGFRKNGYQRKVFNFRKALEAPVFVDQLGTGTVYLKGAQVPAFAAMETAQRFTDIRFARLCHEAGYERICLARRAGLLNEIKSDETIWHEFTKGLPDPVFAEVKVYGRRHPFLGKPLTAALTGEEAL